jgi:hypothetical protein
MAQLDDHGRLLDGKKSPRRFFRDITASTAGKRLLLRILRSQHSHIHVQQRGFCRLLRASLLGRKSGGVLVIR